MRVAVIGAGMAGAACAAVLQERGHEVTVLDKGRAPGGRLAQRRVEGFVFDHGAQYMKARDAGFVAAVEAWGREGVAVPWPAADTGGEPVFVGMPFMGAPVRALLRGCTVRSGVEVAGLRREGEAWCLLDGYGAVLERVPLVVLAIPAPRARALLERAGADAAAAMAEALAPVTIAPCWAGLFGFARRLPLEEESRRMGEGPLVWLARNTGKPGRGGLESWTVHAAPAWSRERLEQTPGEVAAALLRKLAEAGGETLPPVRHVAAHRWRHALVERPLGQSFLADPAAGLALCGDWCLGPRVEAAWLSGRSLGEALA